jgi:hypothetical protein
MDPMSLILAALTAGATAALKDTAGEVIKDGYVALKTAIITAWSAPDNTADVLLAEYESEPEISQKLIEKKFKDQELDKNDDIIALADALLKQVDPDGYAAGKYQVTITNSKNVQVGDRNTQTIIEGDAHTGSGNFNKTVTYEKE